MRKLRSRSDKKKQRNEHLSIKDFLFTRARIHWWLLGVIFILSIIWTVFPMADERRLLNIDDFKLGEKSPRDVFAKFDTSYEAEATEEERQAELIKNVPPVFRLGFDGLEFIKNDFRIVREMHTNQGLSVEEKVAGMKSQFTISGLDDNVLRTLATAPDEEVNAIEGKVESILLEVLPKGVINNLSSFAEKLLVIDYIKPKWDQIRLKLESETSEEVTDEKIAAEMEINLYDARFEPAVERVVYVKDLRDLKKAEEVVQNMAGEMPESIGPVVVAMGVRLIRGNLAYNSDITEQYKKNFLKTPTLINRPISRGDKVVSIGEPVTEEVRDKLKAVSSAQKWSILRSIPGAMLLSGILAFILLVYVRKYETSFFSEPRKAVSLNLAILLILVIGSLLITWKPALRLFIVWGPKLEIERPGFLIPAALASIVIAMLSNVQLAIVVTCIVGVFIAMFAGIGIIGSLQYFLVIFMGGTVAAISASRARRRRHFMLAGLYVSAVNVITLAGLGMLENISIVNISMNCVVGAINGIVVAVLTPGLLPIFEYLSKTTTDVELLELADLNQPLLTRLKQEASGSYYHSIDVAKLAESAAEAIGANPLLTRVGSYYHDIGKMNKPEFFIENQKGENIHDNLSPNMSVRVISAHVKDGVNMAKEYKLPQAVIDIIQQYHGTGLIGGMSFYKKAKEADKHNSIRLEDYRYPGPKPQTKEAAIILLADSVESARHVMLNGSPGYSRLVGFVKEIIDSKLTDSQLDECDLTLRDINLIADAFVKVLSGMYHTRVEYPKASS